jgi:hypothetical protein
MDAIVDLAKVLLPAGLFLYGMYMLVRSFINRDIDTRKLEVRSRAIETILPNRLQAYERMCLFLERIAPQNMLLRLNQPGIGAHEFHRILLDEIRSEYNHNVSQQIYMSENVWNMIKNSKEDLVIMINEASSQLAPEATSLDLAKKIFELVMNKQVDPMGHAMSELKKEIQQIF